MFTEFFRKIKIEKIRLSLFIFMISLLFLSACKEDIQDKPETLIGDEGIIFAMSMPLISPSDILVQPTKMPQETLL